MLELYPPIEPNHSGYVPVGEGHEVYFEECGNPRGIPVVFLHGGPGSSCNPQHRRFFDPAAYRVVLFDQRGCGRSRPQGSTEENTTPRLIADIERLRQKLGIERWLLFGGSWGSTLALSYALKHSGRVLGMVLRGIFLASRQELDWYLMGLREFLPEAWERLCAPVPAPSATSVLKHYHREIAQEATAAQAARGWNDYESAAMAVGEPPGSSGAMSGSAGIARVRVQLHYLAHDCFLERPLLDAVRGLDLPAIIVQGRRDLVCPPLTAYRLHQALPGSELRMAEEAGHSAMNPAMIAALVQATDDMRRRFSSQP
ncbi:MAG: prolyl aminopeptidase [Burkholderiales bacterium]